MTGRRVIALGIDAAEPTLVRRLIDADRMPVLASIVREGFWRAVQSPSDIGSGSVWPTFISGTAPARHGVHAEWAWQPQAMGVARYTGRALDPFWRPLAGAGVPVGVFDVPFAPCIGLPEGFEVCEWGPHDAIDGHVTAQPARAASVVGSYAPHPYYASPVDPAGPHDERALQQLISTSLAGVRARGEVLRALVRETSPALTLAVFSEVHHASHYLWHTIAPDHSLYMRLDRHDDDAIRFGLVEIYREVDRQIGLLLDQQRADDTAVIVFSLHGMRPAFGVAAFLGPWLVEQGFARLSGWAEKTWKERAVGLFGSVKRHSPPALKRLYYRVVPPGATRQLAQPTMLPAYDWARTRAFALPTDQHGWIRVNLRGRERLGVVAEGEYDALLADLESTISALADADGRSLVQRVVRTSPSVRDALASALPDLVVHWTDDALASPVRIRRSRIAMSSIGRKFTSQHALDGFCAARGIDPPDEQQPIQDADLHRLIATALGRSSPAAPTSR